MEKEMKKFLLGVSLSLGIAACFMGTAKAEASQEMYRLYNPNSGEHFYTGSVGERDNLLREGWRNEGTGWRAPDGGTAVYRLYNPNAGDHHYTLNTNEVNYLVNRGWRNENVGWYSDKNQSVPVYRSYNPNASAGAHNFTTSTGERDNLYNKGWRSEGIAWYGEGESTPPVEDNTDVEKLQKEISALVFQKINAYRAELGIQQLQTSSLLQGCGNIRANDLTERFDHVRPDGMRYSTFIDENMNYKASGATLGENIFSFPYEVEKVVPEEFATRVFNSWKSSTGHNDTMINSSANDGTVGVKVQKNGTKYWTTSVVFIIGYNKDYVPETPVTPEEPEVTE